MKKSVTDRGHNNHSLGDILSPYVNNGFWDRVRDRHGNTAVRDEIPEFKMSYMFFL